MFHTPAHHSTTAAQFVPADREYIGGSACRPLGRAKPETSRTITVAEHARNFYLMDCTDVWTDDGWLITAVQTNGIHHMRKGYRVCRVILPPAQVLHYNPTAQSRASGL